MGVYRTNLSRLGKPGAATVAPITFPAPVGGVNALDSLMLVDLTKTNPKLLKRYLGTEGLKRFQEHHTAMALQPQHPG
jgi:hypothetical protein